MDSVRPVPEPPSGANGGAQVALPIRGGHWAVALAVAGLAFWFNDNFILNHFLHGPYLYDTGWFAGVVYHPTWDLRGPPAFGDHASFYNTHVSPILLLLGLPSYWSADILPVYYAKVIGVVYGSLGLAGTLAAEPLTRNWGWRGPLAAGLAGLGLAFSGLSMGAIGFPHFEPLYVGLAVLFLATLFRGKSKWAVLPFGLALLVREDCGLHLFGILLLLFLCSWPVPELQPWRRRLLGYALAGLAYSLCVIALQKTFFPGDNALQRIYLGTPPYAHVTIALIKQRLTYYLRSNKYIFGPVLMMAALAVWRRSWLLLAGLAAVLPWVAFNFFAVSDEAGELHTYYSFPLLVLLIWPILINPLDPRRAKPGAALVSGGMVLGSSLLFFALERPNDFSHTEQFGLTPMAFPVRDYEQGRQLVAALAKQSPGIIFDNAVAGLYPMEIPKKMVYNNQSVGMPPKVFVGFWGGFDHPEKLLGTGTTWEMHELPKPHLYILSQRAFPSGVFGAFSLIAKGPVLAPMVFPNLILGPFSRLDADDSIIDLIPHADQVVEYGPYVSLTAGSYAVHFQWEASEAAASDKLAFAVTVQAGKTTLATQEIAGRDLTVRAGMQSTTLNFRSQGTEKFEFIMHKNGGVKIRLKDIRVEKTVEAP